MSLIDRAKNILMSPKTEWEVIANEEPDTGSIITGYVVPMVGAGAVATFVGYGFIGLAGFHSIMYGVGMAVVQLIVGIVSTYVGAMVIDALAGSFGSEKNFGRSLQLVAYSGTAGWVAAILNIFPPLRFVTWIGSLYGIYIMYLGFKPVKKTPDDKVVVYMIVSAIVWFVLSGILAAILGGIVLTMVVGTAMLGT